MNALVLIIMANLFHLQTQHSIMSPRPHIASQIKCPGRSDYGYQSISINITAGKKRRRKE